MHIHCEVFPPVFLGVVLFSSLEKTVASTVVLKKTLFTKIISVAFGTMAANSTAEDDNKEPAFDPLLIS